MCNTLSILNNLVVPPHPPPVAFIQSVYVSVCVWERGRDSGRMPILGSSEKNTHDVSGSPCFLQPFKVTAPRFAPPFHFLPGHVWKGESSQ